MLRPLSFLAALAAVSGQFPPTTGNWPLTFDNSTANPVPAGAPLRTDLWTPDTALNVLVTRSQRGISNSLVTLSAGGGVRFALLQTGNGVDVNTSLTSIPFFAPANTLVFGYTRFDTSEADTQNNDYSSSVLEDTVTPGNSLLLDRTTVESLGPGGPFLTPWRLFSVATRVASTYRFRFAIANAIDNFNPSYLMVANLTVFFPTPTPTTTASGTRTATSSSTATSTSTSTPSRTASQTSTSSQTGTAMSTVTSTSTQTASQTSSGTRTGTPTSSGTQTSSVSATSSRSSTATSTATVTQTQTSSATRSRTATSSKSSTATGSRSGTRTSTVTSSQTRTSTSSSSQTGSSSSTQTPSPSFTATSTGAPVAAFTYVRSLSEDTSVRGSEGRHYQYYRVPPGVTALRFAAWGAGGGGADIFSRGGAGALVTGTMKVRPGELLRLIVGRGGIGGTPDNATTWAGSDDQGGGGGLPRASNWTIPTNSGGSGGGRTAIQKYIAGNWVEIMTVAGGGGGGGFRVHGGAAGVTQGFRPGNDWAQERNVSCWTNYQAVYDDGVTRLNSWTGGGAITKEGWSGAGQGGEGCIGPLSNGRFLKGGDTGECPKRRCGGGGGGWFGGGAGKDGPGGGGSSRWDVSHFLSDTVGTEGRTWRAPVVDTSTPTTSWIDIAPVSLPQNVAEGGMWSQNGGHGLILFKMPSSTLASPSVWRSKGAVPSLTRTPTRTRTISKTSTPSNTPSPSGTGSNAGTPSRTRKRKLME